MKFMKIGTRQDTFYTEDATRSLSSDVPSDLAIQINNTKYLLHKFPLLPKCGLLQSLCTFSEDTTEVSIVLHDIPGGEEAFELCAKFCYGITINLSANNIIAAICGAKFLRMTESVEKGNFILKLETFFNSCILEGWKDTVITLQSTSKLPEWSENLGIIRRCIDSIIDKILTHPTKITWSYTYTRPGYAKKRHHSIPKDWWTEDISHLDIDLFRCIVTAIQSTNMLPAPLIGEALHVYACKWLPYTSGSPTESSVPQAEDLEKQRKVLETVVSLIPSDHGSVSIGFLLRLLNIAHVTGATQSTKAELIRRTGWQLEEATVDELLFPSCLSFKQDFYGIDLVQTVLDSFLSHWRRQTITQDNEAQLSVTKVAKLIDSYLQVVAKDVNIPATKIITLAEALPEIARPDHDNIYKAINNYLKKHPDLSKAEKKRLCQVLDCRKLSKEVCSHAIRNERLPLRTVVQVLFFDQDRRSRMTSHKLPMPNETLESRCTSSVTTREDHGKKVRSSEIQLSSGAEDIARGTSMPTGERMMRRTVGGPTLEPETKLVRKIKDTEITEEGVSTRKLDSKKVIVRNTKQEKIYHRGNS